MTTSTEIRSFEGTSPPANDAKHPKAAATPEESSSDGLVPSSGALAGGANITDTRSSGPSDHPTSKARKNLANPRPFKGDVEVFDTLPHPSFPYSPLEIDGSSSNSTSDDGCDGATNTSFIKMFDAVHIAYSSPSRKRPSDTTKDPPRRKMQCSSEPQARESVTVSTYVPVPWPLPQVVKDPMLSAATSLKDSFKSELSFVESIASQFSDTSRSTQLTEPDIEIDAANAVSKGRSFASALGGNNIAALDILSTRLGELFQSRILHLY